ncbi:MAG TPA: hypothetical protein VHR18_10495 [Solirubrobacterales bacterium]|nr:hypothetical protein [Solirubrobacterales bacterium]
MKLARRHLSYANVISTICLFILLGGGAYAAARLPAKSVGTAQLKAGAVTGAKIKDGTITGAKVDSRTLGPVPTASSADRATSAESAAFATKAGSAAKADLATKASLAANSEMLGGNPASSFVANSQVGYIDRSFSGCTLSIACVSDVLTIAGVTVRATCEYNAGVSAMILRVIGATRTGYAYATNNTEARRGQFEGDGNVIATVSAGPEVGATGTIVARTPARIITLSFDASSLKPAAAPSTGACELFATALAV